ncbi:hypothetical protein [Streptomyces sp. CBMA156]|uniref:hypothetical protein n=1 Tax=Streptomyces sp. CBMA156 TaxID=1930280 RepID=UPI001661EA69|nr:hypothetical protein [Streptomyces sp. CBMA156]MBD0671658.1 hypothetical protein [Streptomyces sp. CBMA156]
MEMISGTGLGRPWPELMLDRRPALIVPAAPTRPLLAEDGWAGRDDLALAAGPQSAWSTVLAGCRLTVRRPGGLVWFDGEVAATREWRQRVHGHGALLLVTGPFTGVFDFRSAAEAGRLFLLTAPVRPDDDA